MNLSKEELVLHDKMAEKLPELIEEYFKRPEIISIGISLKTVNNQMLDRFSYTFGVKNITIFIVRKISTKRNFRSDKFFFFRKINSLLSAKLKPFVINIKPALF